jgi:hypothetical protein
VIKNSRIILTEKYVRPTDKDHGHTRIYTGPNYWGYIIQNRDKSRAHGDNWRFVPVVRGLKALGAPNRKALLDKVRKAICKIRNK